MLTIGPVAHTLSEAIDEQLNNLADDFEYSDMASIEKRSSTADHKGDCVKS